jgi:hypothetical protein
LVSNQWINGADAMPRNRPNDYILSPVKDQKPIDDFFASDLAERIRMDNWRKQLNLIRGEILDIAEQGSQHGLGDVKRETVKLARAIERLEASLGRKAAH